MNTMQFPSDFSQWRVLVIDDEPDNLSLLQEILTLRNMQVALANSGTEGLALMKSFDPTLIILDLAMPAPDGWEVIAAVKQTMGKSLPVIAVTAYYSEHVRREALTAGFVAIFEKPIRVATFVKDVLATLGVV